jgi:hypothetical protein
MAQADRRREPGLIGVPDGTAADAELIYGPGEAAEDAGVTRRPREAAVLDLRLP